MPRTIEIPVPQQSNEEAMVGIGPGHPVILDVSSGNSIVLVGANGSGKTRLGAYIEQMLDDKGHRIAAQRSIRMEDRITLSDYDSSLLNLHQGHPEERNNRAAYRWRNDPYNHPIDDFSKVLQALFAEKNRKLSDDHAMRLKGQDVPPPRTMLDVLLEIWQRLLPNRTLEILDASIKVRRSTGASGDLAPYQPSKMSDGERVIFYLIGQCLLAPQNSVIIIDEPELHVHPSISAILWDSLEAEREDCALVYITHDIEFATARASAKKYFVRGIYNTSFWDIEAIPESSDLPESLVMLLAGNRRPVLFVESKNGKYDELIYRAAYPAMRVEPRGACDTVIHTVVTFRANPSLHKLGKTYGCIDSDHRSDQNKDYLRTKLNIECLRVAEVENIFLVRSAFFAIARALNFKYSVARDKFEKVADQVFADAKSDRQAVAVRYLIRFLDRAFKNVRLDTKDVAALKQSFITDFTGIDLDKEACDFLAKFDQAIADKDFDALLEMYDRKGLLSYVAQAMEVGSSQALVAHVTRLMQSKKHKLLRSTFQAVLPRFPES